MNESASDSRLDHLLADYLRRIDNGEAVTFETLQAEQPQHATALWELIDTVQLINDLAGPTQAEDEGGNSQASTVVDVEPPPAQIRDDQQETDHEAEDSPAAPSDPDLEPTVIDRPTGGPSGDTQAWETRAAAPPQSTDEADQLLGDTIDDYQILSVLGKGGMGVVYKARQISVDRIVAIKMILGGRFATDEDVQRFYIEAQAAARAKHPNIVSVYEVGQCEGRMYFSMEYIDGVDLAEMSKSEGSLDGRRAAEYLKKIAEAMHDAHEAGVLHRDLKPANVLIDRKDRPRVTDFGLAKHLDEDSGLTASGAAVGTPSYMSPEQASGRHDLASPQTDVYALGAVLYVMLTGKPPFRAATPLQTIMEVINVQPKPPEQINPNVDHDLQTICLKCLEKEPKNRFASAHELAEELDRYLTGRPILSKPRGQLENLRLWLLNVPLIAAACGRPIMHATPGHRRFQAAIMLLVLISPLLGYLGLAAWRQALPSRIVIAAGPGDGAYHGVASLLKSPIEELTEKKVVVHESSGSAENYQMLASGRSHLAFLQASELADLDSNHVVIVAPIYYEAIHVIVRKSSGINSISQLAQRRVSLGAAGSSMQSSARMLLKHYEERDQLKGDSIVDAKVGYMALMDPAQDPPLDAAIVTIGLSSAGVKRVLSDPRFELLPLADAADFSHPTLRAYRIPANAYGPGVPSAPIQTIATPAFLATGRRAPNRLVDAALRALYRESVPGGVSRRDATDWPGLALHQESHRFFLETKQAP